MKGVEEKYGSAQRRSLELKIWSEHFI